MDSNISIRAMLARLVPVAVIAGLLMLGATAMAKPAKPPIGVPHQLEEVRAALMAMQAQLNKMQDGMGKNANDLEDLTKQMHDQMDLIDTSTEEVFQSVNSVELTSKLCFDSSAALGIKLGGVGEFGASWTKVLHAEVALELDEFWNLDTGVGSEFCIQVPVYSVYWPELEVSPSEGALLHPLIAGTSGPGRYNLPILGLVSEQVLPPPESVRNVLEAVELAMTSGNPADARKLLSPATYTPMMPPLLTTMITAGAELVLGAVIDPCGAIESNPLFTGIEPVTYNWMCILDPDETMQIIVTIANVADVLFGWL